MYIVPGIVSGIVDAQILGARTYHCSSTLISFELGCCKPSGQILRGGQAPWAHALLKAPSRELGKCGFLL